MAQDTMTSTIDELTEQIRDWCPSSVEVDRSARVVRNIALTGLKSRNGYRYSEQALRDAVSQYENKPVFLDHAANVSRPFERSTRDLVGSIVNPRFEENRIRADIQVLDTDAGRTFTALAENNGPAVGMSHVVLAERSGDRLTVEKIHEVVSVDAVVFPATTSTFREQVEEFPRSTLPGSYESILADIDAGLSDHVGGLAGVACEKVQRIGLFPKQILVEVFGPSAADCRYFAVGWSMRDGELEFGDELTEIEAERVGRELFDSFSNKGNVDELQAQIAELTGERDRGLADKAVLQERLEGIEDERRSVAEERQIDGLLEEAGLPSFAVTELFREQLLAATDARDRVRLIAERKALVSASAQPPPRSRERPGGDSRRSDDALVIGVIKKQRLGALCVGG